MSIQRSLCQYICLHSFEEFSQGVDENFEYIFALETIFGSHEIHIFACVSKIPNYTLIILPYYMNKFLKCKHNTHESMDYKEHTVYCLRAVCIYALNSIGQQANLFILMYTPAYVCRSTSAYIITI